MGPKPYYILFYILRSMYICTSTLLYYSDVVYNTSNT